MPPSKRKSFGSDNASKSKPGKLSRPAVPPSMQSCVDRIIQWLLANHVCERCFLQSFNWRGCYPGTWFTCQVQWEVRFLRRFGQAHGGQLSHPGLPGITIQVGRENVPTFLSWQRPGIPTGVGRMDWWVLPSWRSVPWAANNAVGKANFSLARSSQAELLWKIDGRVWPCRHPALQLGLSRRLWIFWSFRARGHGDVDSMHIDRRAGGLFFLMRVYFQNPASPCHPEVSHKLRECGWSRTSGHCSTHGGHADPWVDSLQPFVQSKPGPYLAPLLVSCLLSFYQLLFSPSGELLPPFSVAYVKGWRRATAFLACLVATKECEIELGELPNEFRVNWLYRPSIISYTVIMGSQRKLPYVFIRPGLVSFKISCFR